MLRHIDIRHYALIDHLDMELAQGFTVITGETGAGKSIIMGALGLLMGQRADAKSIRAGETKCVVEARFDIAAYGLAPLFEELDLDYDDETVVRREIHSNGKSRAFVNDTPVSLSQLKSLAPHLIDIHSQHQNLLLNDSSFQLKVVDAIARSHDELSRYAACYGEYMRVIRELESLRRQAQKALEERDFAQFQYDQLSEAALSATEQEELETELDRLNHAEEVKSELSAISARFDSDEYGLLQSLKEALSSVRRIARYIDEGETLAARVESSLIELRDLGSEFGAMYNDLEFDPERKRQIEERLDLIYTLEQKHRVKSVAELIALQEEFEAKLQRMDEYDSEIEELARQADALHAELEAAASALSEKRRAVTGEIEDALVERLSYLGMPNASCRVEVAETEGYTSTGRDCVSFLFSANRNTALRPIADIASGGEISRVMLCIKALIASKSELPTIVLDEIDTGVSGEVANRMGEMMRQMAEHMQVITITHLPQIAARGAAHFKVYKADTEEGTTSNIRLLTPEGRLMEIAEMLSGKNPSESAIANARELMGA
ncbi:MAG: DNA repair protein RecN [bacterium]|uniref:DNA repair protein RecN n=1 Tax=Candidatus Aphodosoma intestinipullorum TaxID=2840674 RepID=A0A940DLL5_9BACT|nr:DNA repair protein RecN [Candidatus Aphodosoma intestinipullorum]